MTWITSFFVALVSAMVGLLLGGLLGNACVSWYHISSREGQSGYFVIFAAIGGGIAGFMLGFLAARIMAWSSGPSFGKELIVALSTVLLTTGSFTAICRLLADIPPTLDGCKLNLEVEFRFPSSLSRENPPTFEGDWQYTLASISGQTRRKHSEGKIHTDIARYENRQWIVPTQVELFTERGHRSVTLSPRDATEVMGFTLPLPARPSAEFEKWSDWMPRQQANGQPWPSDKMSCRFRVQKVSDAVESKLE